jgi:hypothetical protein
MNKLPISKVCFVAMFCEESPSSMLQLESGPTRRHGISNVIMYAD